METKKARYQDIEKTSNSIQLWKTVKNSKV